MSEVEEKRLNKDKIMMFFSVVVDFVELVIVINKIVNLVIYFFGYKDVKNV